METNIWELSKEERKALPFGARVMAGTDGSKGTFLGIRQSGVVVVAWDKDRRIKEPQYLVRLVKYALDQ
jgi:hypothetical protein